MPDVFCNRCKQAFHTPCLMTWLTAERHARATRGVALTTLSGPRPRHARRSETRSCHRVSRT
ncbi:MAG: hypothetical protein GY826_10085 [Fuerstiella sp.]|nr:hypothetical protein [Fuerstiella sp.]